MNAVHEMGLKAWTRSSPSTGRSPTTAFCGRGLCPRTISREAAVRQPSVGRSKKNFRPVANAGPIANNPLGRSFHRSCEGLDATSSRSVTDRSVRWCRSGAAECDPPSPSHPDGRRHADPPYSVTRRSTTRDLATVRSRGAMQHGSRPVRGQGAEDRQGPSAAPPRHARNEPGSHRSGRVSPNGAAFVVRRTSAKEIVMKVKTKIKAAPSLTTTTRPWPAPRGA